MNDQIRHGESNARATHDPAFAQPVTVPVTVHRLADRYGVTVKHKNLTAATKLLARSDEAAEAVTSWRARRANAPYDVVHEFASGEAAASDLPDRLAEATVAAQVSDTTMNGYLDVLTKQVERMAATELRNVPEDAWLAPFRPVVESLLAECNTLADTLAIDAPRPQVPGVRSMLHRWEPTPTELSDINRRHAWEKLAEKLSELYDLLGLVVDLRVHGLVRDVDGRPLAHMLWWKHLDRLDGDPLLLREFFLANRHEGGLGLWSTEQLLEVDTKATLDEQDRRKRTAFDARYASAQQFEGVSAGAAAQTGSVITS